MFPTPVSPGSGAGFISSESLGQSLSRRATRSFNTLRFKDSTVSMSDTLDSQPMKVLRNMRSSVRLGITKKVPQLDTVQQDGAAADHDPAHQDGDVSAADTSGVAASKPSSEYKTQEAVHPVVSRSSSSVPAQLRRWASTLSSRFTTAPGDDAASPFFRHPPIDLKVPHLGSLQGYSLNFVLAIVASASFTEWGYEQGVLSGLLTLEDFQRAIPYMAPYEPDNAWCREEIQCMGTHGTQAIGVGIYQIGCFLGAIAVLQYGDGWGRRNSAFWGTLVVIVGTTLQAMAQGGVAVSYMLFIVGRTIAGFGNGVVTAR